MHIVEHSSTVGVLATLTSHLAEATYGQQAISQTGKGDAEDEPSALGSPRETVTETSKSQTLNRSKPANIAESKPIMEVRI